MSESYLQRHRDSVGWVEAKGEGSFHISAGLNLCLHHAEDSGEYSTARAPGFATLEPPGTSKLVRRSILSLWVLAAGMVTNCPFRAASWGGEPG